MKKINFRRSQIIEGNHFLRKMRNLIKKLPGAKALYGKFTPNFTYSYDGLITNKNCDFMKDSKFIEAYTKGRRQWDIPGLYYWTFHVIQWAAHFTQSNWKETLLNVV